MHDSILFLERDETEKVIYLNRMCFCKNREIAERELRKAKILGWKGYIFNRTADEFTNEVAGLRRKKPMKWGSE